MKLPDADSLRWLAVALALAALVRLLGLCWGLPYTPNADEPHIVDLAVSFGAGTLRPYAFKYPTLWPYLLFFLYGLYFLAWSLFGLRRSVADFAVLFAWHPGGFYLIARLAAAVFSLAAPLVLWRMEKDRPLAALLLAFSPVVVVEAHSGKPDTLMFLFSCAAWGFALRVLRRGARRDYWLCGTLLGLAATSQFTALPACAVLPLAALLRPGKTDWRFLAEGIACGAAAFLLGSPYALIEPRFFLSWLGGAGSYAASAASIWKPGPFLAYTARTLGDFAGPFSIGGALALLGLFVRPRGGGRRALLLALPVLAYAALLSSPLAAGARNPRYLFAVLPAWALLAADGFEALKSATPRRAWIWLAALIVLPGLALDLSRDAKMRAPDPRAQAADWIRAHVPEGTALLMDVPHACPHLVMVRPEVEELARRTAASGSPRARLYRAMAAGHPGGGYRIYRIERTALDLGTLPKIVALSQADAPMLDVRAGLAPARAAGVRWVVLSSFGARPETSPELAGFFSALKTGATLAKVFPASSRFWPTIEIYELNGGRRA
ncbi:MAG: glycosyltransferase family 39 protein [Elusimicrobia bacterium]|nr:glycosyltransferase family 39 protein [Elusimicrobiota bacterium]